MRFSILLFFLFLQVSITAQNLRSGGVLKPVQANMDIRHYTLSLDVDPVQKTFYGNIEITCNLQNPSADLLLDLWDSLTVTEVTVNGKSCAFKHENDWISFSNATGPWPAGKTTIRVVYGGKPGIATRPPWTGGVQWEKDGQGNPWIALTCQGEGAKIFFPCKDHPSDEPNEGAEMYITVPKGLMAVGPGMLQGSKNNGNKTTWHWKTNYTISNYCFVFNIGKYKAVTREYTSVNGNKVPMIFYVLEEHADKAPHQLEMMERTTHILEKYFGEYPWIKERIGLCETPHLGMEHQTNIAYGNKFRYTQVGGKDFDWLMNHEFGHEWWANKVTNRDWAHMWIQEGICTYGDILYYREMEGEASYMKKMAQTGRAQEGNIPVVRGEEVDSDSAYKGPIYGKGAFFLHTIRYIVGDNVFFPTLKKLATDPAYTYNNTVTTQDVEKLFSGASGINLKPVFDFYLYTSQKLEIRVKETAEGKYTLQLLNFDSDIPIDVVTDEGKKRMMLNKKPVNINSKTLPRIDPDYYYLKKVIYE